MVLAAHGREGIERLVLGSVAETVIRKAGCPVVTLRGAHAQSDPSPSTEAKTSIEK